MFFSPLFLFSKSAASNQEGLFIAALQNLVTGSIQAMQQFSTYNHY